MSNPDGFKILISHGGILPPKDAPKWSSKWYRFASSEELRSIHTSAKESLDFTSRMRQHMARLLWQNRLESIEKELDRRTKDHS